MGLAAGYIYQFGPQSFTFLYEHFLGLVTASVLFSYAASFVLYISSFYGEKLLALNANSGYHGHDVRALGMHEQRYSLNTLFSSGSAVSSILPSEHSI